MDNEDLIVIIVLNFDLEAFLDIFGIIELLHDLFNPWPFLVILLIIFFFLTRFLNLFLFFLNLRNFLSGRILVSTLFKEVLKLIRIFIFINQLKPIILFDLLCLLLATIKDINNGLNALKNRVGLWRRKLVHLQGIYLSVRKLTWGLRGLLEHLLLGGSRLWGVFNLSEEELFNDGFHAIFSICENLVGEEWKSKKLF